MLVRTLSTLECAKLLAANRVGHLACAKGRTTLRRLLQLRLRRQSPLRVLIAGQED